MNSAERQQCFYLWDGAEVIRMNNAATLSFPISATTLLSLSQIRKKTLSVFRLRDKTLWINLTKNKHQQRRKLCQETERPRCLWRLVIITEEKQTLWGLNASNMSEICFILMILSQKVRLVWLVWLVWLVGFKSKWFIS